MHLDDMFILCTYWFPSRDPANLQIEYRILKLIMLPFLCPVSKWHFTHKEYNKQYPETNLDEIQEWIEYLSTKLKYVLCRFSLSADVNSPSPRFPRRRRINVCGQANVGLTTIQYCQYSSMCSNTGFSRRKVQYCGLTGPFASSPDFCYNERGL